MFSDPLSDALDLVNVRCEVSGTLLAGGPWSIRFPRPGKIKFNAVIKGSTWLLIEGADTPIRLESGDAVLFNGKHSFLLASDFSAPEQQAVDLFRESIGRTARVGSADEYHAVGGHVALDASGIDLLLDVLPPVIHVKANAPEAGVIGWLLSQLVREMDVGRPGASRATSQLAQLLFLQVMRAHIDAAEPLSAGWLRAIGDEKIAPAIRLMHAEPARAWQLGELAKAVGMSRTSFAERFKAVAGVAPLTYLANWRMRLAERALRDGSEPVSALALSLGYTSESAFSNAFKRIVGLAPNRYRAAARNQVPADEIEFADVA
jgi:AraC-like DNA-binding protein